MKWLKGMCLSVIGITLISGGFMGSNASEAIVKTSYTMPEESAPHEGTWLQWPHHYTYGVKYQKKLEPIWLAMTKALAEGEEVHLIVYNATEKRRVVTLLQTEGDVNVENLSFHILQTNDVWIRDNGPVFAYNAKDELVMLNWGFNGWGKKAPYKRCAEIPKQLSKILNIDRVDLKTVVLEGGAIELDGGGVGLTTRSSVSNKNRNPKLTEAQIEKVIKQTYGLKKMIWLDGVVGEDITDFHIDGFARFYNEKTLVTMKPDDLAEWGLNDKDVDTLLFAKNREDKIYKKVYLPLTKGNVILESGKNLGYKGSYLNYYVGNEVVLVPNYNDLMDQTANSIIQKLYPDREVVGLDIRELYEDGGMIHCVTQQQPIDKIKP